MIIRYRVDYEFEAEDLFKAQDMLNAGLVPVENMTHKSLEAICSEDRIIPRKWVPKKEPAVVTFPDAAPAGEEPEDRVKLPEDEEIPF